MEVITIESSAYKYLTKKIDTIEKLVISLHNKVEEKPEDIWVDSYEVCTFLKVGEKTLQRLRSDKTVAYTKIRGKNFYRISEIQRLMNENIIQRNDEQLQDLIQNQKLYAEQRRAIKPHK